jgi:hypothetical protein
MGAHHDDIAQWSLDMDESGPVEIIPPEDPSTGTGVRYIYANGVEMTHGGPGGCTFTGTEYRRSSCPWEPMRAVAEGRASRITFRDG